MMKPELVGERATTRPVFLQPSTTSGNAAPVYQDNAATKKYAEFNKVLQEQVMKEPGYRYGLEGGLNPAAGEFEKATFIPEATQKAVRGEWSPEQAVDFMDKQIRQLLEKK
jgi:ABC-type glycerol-3-phosphate transport system substrate-binding protein